MQPITPALEAILKAKFQAAAAGFRSRIEIDLAEFTGAPTCVANNGQTYELTPAGVYTGIGPPFASGGNWHYISTALIAYDSNPTTASPFPTAGENLHWGNGGVGNCVYTDGGIDYGAGGGIRWIHLRVVGPGTMVVVTAAAVGPCANGGAISGTATVSGGGATVVDSDSGVPGDALTFVIPDDGACAHHIQMGGGVGGGEFGFVSATWTPLVPLVDVTYSTLTVRPSTVSIDKSLRLVADQASIEIPNPALELGWGPDSLLKTNLRCRIFQWYGDEANAIQTFTGLLDQIHDHRDVLTTSLTARDLMAIVIDQTFSTIGPQNADESGAIRTEANGVYLNREVSYILNDILDRVGWPAADRDITVTSYVLDEFIIPDGASAADVIIGDEKLTGLVGYSAWADELGIFHFAPTALSQNLTDPVAPVYTFRAGEDVVSLDDATDQYDLRTRIKVRGPLTTQTLQDTWRELWRTSKFHLPVGIWFDPSDPGNIRVLDRGTKRLYKLRQSDRAVLSSVYLGAAIAHPLGISGDPADATVYWVLEAPWRFTGSTSGNKVKKVRKSDNAVLGSYAIPNGRWSAIKVSSAHIWLTNLDTDRFYKRSKTDATGVASYSHTVSGVVQRNPSGIMVDGTTLYVFWANSGTTARFLVCQESAPGTITKIVKTAGTNLHGGEMDTLTHTECWGDSDSLGLVAKFTLVAAVSQTDEVFAEVVDIDLEDELGLAAQLQPRVHDAHPGDAVHPFEVRRKTLDLSVITSLAQATETAQRQLDLDSVRRRVVDTGIVGNPALQKTDPVAVIDPVTGVSDSFAIDTYRSQMTGDGTYLGTLALLPIGEVTDEPTSDPPAADDPGIVEGGDPGDETGLATTTVATIPALLAALLDDSLDVIIVADGSYLVDSAFAHTASSLYIGSAYASRTRAVTVRAATPGGVTFHRGGAAGGAIAFVQGAHHQTWTGFHFANMTISGTGVIFFGGIAGADAPHDITLRTIVVDATCHRVGAGATDHALYFSYALDTWANIIVDDYTVEATSAMGMASGVHMDHGGSGDAPNVPAHGVRISSFVFHGNPAIVSQQAIILWTPPIHDWIVDGATITNAGDVAVRFESVGAYGIELRNITSTGSVTQGFYSSLGTYPTVPGVTFVSDSFG